MELGVRMRDQSELMSIKYLTSGTRQRKIAEMMNGQGKWDGWGEVGHELDNILPVYHLTSLCDRLICYVRVACTYRKDVDELEQRRKAY